MTLPTITGRLLSFRDRSYVLNHIVQFGSDGEKIWLGFPSSGAELDFAFDDDYQLTTTEVRKEAAQHTLNLLREYFGHKDSPPQGL